MYLEDGDSVVVMASKAGQPTNPAWFHNLMRTRYHGHGPTVRKCMLASPLPRSAHLWSRFVAMYPAPTSTAATPRAARSR